MANKGCACGGSKRYFAPTNQHLYATPNNATNKPHVRTLATTPNTPVVTPAVPSQNTPAAPSSNPPAANSYVAALQAYAAGNKVNMSATTPSRTYAPTVTVAPKIVATPAAQPSVDVVATTAPKPTTLGSQNQAAINPYAAALQSYYASRTSAPKAKIAAPSDTAQAVVDDAKAETQSSDAKVEPQSAAQKPATQNQVLNTVPNWAKYKFT
jgi:hypothetical protein